MAWGEARHDHTNGRLVGPIFANNQVRSRGYRNARSANMDSERTETLAFASIDAAPKASYVLPRL